MSDEIGGEVAQSNSAILFSLPARQRKGKLQNFTNSVPSGWNPTNASYCVAMKSLISHRKRSTC
jgi:hypothetical protein